MKNKSIIFISLLFSLLISGCVVVCDCLDADCGKHGACNETEGYCTCETGYQANVMGMCDSVSREKFLGHTTQLKCVWVQVCRIPLSFRQGKQG